MPGVVIFFLVLFVVFFGCDSTGPESNDNGFIGSCENPPAVEASETFDGISLLQHKSVIASAGKAIAVNQDSHHFLPSLVAHENDSSRFAGVVGVLRFAWLWSPFLIAAAVCSHMRQWNQKSVCQQLGVTSALTGFRLFSGLWIMMEHAGLHSVSGSGVFVVLSGVVLSTSRRVSPGVSFQPIESFSSYFRFMFMRLARILPLYWFYEMVVVNIVPDAHAGFVEERLHYLTHIPKTCMLAWMHAPLKMLLITPAQYPWHTWFVQTILVLYLFYPLLERVALGPKSLQPAHTWRLHALFGMCCLAKLATVTVMILVFDDLEFDSWYHWKGWSLYPNPILRLPDFMLGVLVPHLAVPQAKNVFTTWAPMATDFLFCLMVIMAVIMPQTKESRLLCHMNFEAPLLALVMWGLCFGPQQSQLGRFFSLPCVVTAGEWGYGIYLFHPKILNLTWAWGYVEKPGKPFGLQTTQFNGLWEAVAITFMMSWSTFVLIERPMGQCARWIANMVFPSL